MNSSILKAERERGRFGFGETTLIRLKTIIRPRACRIPPFVAIGLLIGNIALASTPQSGAGYDAWLRYDSIDETARLTYDKLPAVIVSLDDSIAISTARDELIRGIRGLLGRTLRVATALPDENAIVLGTVDSIKRAIPSLDAGSGLKQDGYVLKTVAAGGKSYLVITARNDRGVLYGSFALLRKICLRDPIESLDERQDPCAPVRMLDQWDNLDGTIERGYAGRSIFFDKDNVVPDLGRVRDYARLMASVGINACSINNVNADTRVITTEFLPQLARVAAAFRPWGVRLFVSIDFSSPRKIGGLDTFDPLDPRVADWWKKKVDEIYGLVPDFGGFVLKADSEGRLGPSAYGRTHADAANVIALGLKPHRGLIFYRGFVYDHHMDWRNPKNDRASAAYDNFKTLDGKFEDNVVLQIKHGPIDFQVREPASPLCGALQKTNDVIELQVTQEYTGQQRHLCFLVPMWKEVLDFDMHAKGAGTPVKQLVAGKTFDRPTGGFVAVANVGASPGWLGHPLAMANLYGFGRLAWNPDLSSTQIAEEWTRLTFGNDPLVVKTIVGMQLASWPAYENYTGPLGAGTLTDIIHVHYGPGIESSERNGWGQWHRADEKGIGMDRTVATGTGFIGQYRQPVARVYESLQSCPDQLLLFMHHVPYTYVLHSGKTVIQHIYDSHYDGAEQAARFVESWVSIKGKIDEQRYYEVLDRLRYQSGHAQVWRDAVCNWFLKESGIPDAKGRAGHFPGRIEAEAMRLQGYRVSEVTPWEAASGGKAVACTGHAQPCTASFRYEGEPGWYDLRIQYFDQNNGVSRFKVFVAGQMVSEWTADDSLPTAEMNAHSSTSRIVAGLALRRGDEVLIQGIPDGGEGAPLDYVEIYPSRR
jgi:alpha-glucuronidase